MIYMAWIPKYIRQVLSKRPGQIISSEQWNELFNLLIGQGDYNSELLATMVDPTTGKADLVGGRVPITQMPPTLLPGGFEQLVVDVGTLQTLTVSMQSTTNGQDKASNARIDLLKQNLELIQMGGIAYD